MRMTPPHPPRCILPHHDTFMFQLSMGCLHVLGILQGVDLNTYCLHVGEGVQQDAVGC